jgi:hypothetical protein
MTPAEMSKRVEAIKEHGLDIEKLPDDSVMVRIKGDGDSLLFENSITLSPIPGQPSVYEPKGLVKLPTLNQRRMLRKALKVLGFKMKISRHRK